MRNLSVLNALIMSSLTLCMFVRLYFLHLSSHPIPHSIVPGSTLLYAHTSWY